jgi:prepilin-type N-terminal cleavage/methylation domain-containing protein
MNARADRRGFTLVEMLVVIGIIVVLVGILFPVFAGVREQARQTQCLSNLHQLGIALKAYRTDYGWYPFAPYYDTDLGKYVGGFSALFPDYVDDRALFICPNDRTIDSVKQASRDRNYCSYNGLVSAPNDGDEDSWQFDVGTFTNIETGASISDGPTRYYNYYGYDNTGVDCYNNVEGDDDFRPYANSTPDWLKDQGLKYRHYPRLINRQAPDTTVVTHCVHHRGEYKNEAEEIDLILRLGGTSDKIHRMAWQSHETDDVSKFVTQRE